MKKLLFLSLSTIQCMVINAQIQQPTLNLPEVLPPSTSEMMKYIDHPVDLAHGLASVEIPLYVIKEGDLEIPVLIKYHSSGIKVTDTGNGVGLGWALDFGPSLSRKINGMSDENGYLYNPGTPKNTSYTHWYYVNSLYPYLRQLANGSADEYPDEYYYKLLSNSGKYSYDRGHPDAYTSPVIKTMPFDPVRIGGAVAGVIGDVITDDKGIQYHFGRSALDNSSWITAGAYLGSDTEWKIREVISSNKRDTIYYNYQSGDYRALRSEIIGSYVMIEELEQCIWGLSYDPNVAGYGLYYPFISRTEANDYVHVYNISEDGSLERAPENYQYGTWEATPFTEIRDRALSSICSRTVEVKMDWNQFVNDIPRLKNITVSTRATKSIIKIIDFIYSNPVGSGRNLLNKIIIKDRNGAVEQTYDFEYYSPQLILTGVRSAADYWGYGIHSSLNGVPTQTVSYRNHRYNYGEEIKQITIGDGGGGISYGVFNGLLKSVTFPTGRKSTFHYENNQVKRLDGKVEKTGGARIQKIEEYEPVSGATVTRTFKYGSNEDGGGNIKYDVSPEDYMLEYYKFGPNSYGLMDGLVYKTRIFYSAPFGDPNYQNGAVVSYEYVTEYVDGKGKTEYLFHKDESYIHHEIGTPITIEMNKERAGSELLRKTEYRYDHSDNSYHKIREERNDYGEFNKTWIRYGMSYERLRYINPDNPVDPLTEVEYFQRYNGLPYFTGSLYSAARKLTQQTIETFDGPRSSIQTITYDYGNPNHLYPTRQTVSTNMYPIVTSYSYPLDAGTPEGSALKNHNILSPVLQQEKTVGNETWVTKNRYDYLDGSYVPLLISMSEGPNINKLRTMLEVKKYDASGNPVHVVDKTKNIVYLWGYGGHKLIAEIQNSTYSVVAAKLSQTVIDRIRKSPTLNSSDRNLLNSLRSISGVLVTTIEHESPFGISCITDPSGRRILYEYDNAGRLDRVKDEDGNPLEEYEYNYSK